MKLTIINLYYRNVYLRVYRYWWTDGDSIKIENDGISHSHNFTKHKTRRIDIYYSEDQNPSNKSDDYRVEIPAEDLYRKDTNRLSILHSNRDDKNFCVEINGKRQLCSHIGEV